LPLDSDVERLNCLDCEALVLHRLASDESGSVNSSVPASRDDWVPEIRLGADSVV